MAGTKMSDNSTCWENEEKLKYWFTAGGNVKWCSWFGKQSGSSSNKHRNIMSWLLWLGGLSIGLWTKRWKITGSIPSQGTSLGWGPGPWLGACEKQLIDVSLAHWCFFPSLSPSLPLSLLLSLKINKMFLKIKHRALAGVARWIEHWPVKQGVTGLIPSHTPGLWAWSPVGDVWEATTHWCVSPSLSLSFPLSLKINKIFKNE